MAGVFIILILGSVAVWAQAPGRVETKKTATEAKIDTSPTHSSDQNRQMQKQEEKKFKTGPYDREGNYTIELEENDGDLPE